MGLSISREVLEFENYTIDVVAPREGSNVTFKLSKQIDENYE